MLDRYGLKIHFCEAMMANDHPPPKPLPRQGKVSLWQYASMFRRDILLAQPARLYGTLMAEFKTPFSCLIC